MSDRKLCKEPGCECRAYRRGLCNKHYELYKRFREADTRAMAEIKREEGEARREGKSNYFDISHSDREEEQRRALECGNHEREIFAKGRGLR